MRQVLFLSLVTRNGGRVYINARLVAYGHLGRDVTRTKFAACRGIMARHADFFDLEVWLAFHALAIETDPLAHMLLRCLRVHRFEQQQDEMERSRTRTDEFRQSEPHALMTWSTCWSFDTLNIA